MSQSIRWPLQRTPQGGLAKTISPEESTRQIVVVSIPQGFSSNPFERASGIGGDGDTYSVSSPGGSNKLLAFMKNRMRFLEKSGRARLENGPTIFSISGTGKRKIRFDYLDLESQVPRDVDEEV